MDLLDRIRHILRDALQLGERADSFTASTPLLGSIAEFDSMAVVSVLTMLEEEFGITVADDEISAATFETLGSLTAFVAEKVDA
jgi:acyl carrier protein